MKVSELLVPGRELEVDYLLGDKYIGNFKIAAVFMNTFQVTSLDTGNSIYLPHLEASDVEFTVGFKLLAGPNPVARVVIWELKTVNQEPAIYAYNFKLSEKEYEGTAMALEKG